MIDPIPGTFSFDGHDAVVLGPKLSEDEFRQSSLGQPATPLVRNGEHTSWRLGRVHIARRELAVSCYFTRSVLRQVRLCVTDKRFGESWDDWTEQKELARKAEHDGWLDATLGTARQFAWGSVSSTYDAKGGGSSIVVTYQESS
jgi:hypothetical protein